MILSKAKETKETPMNWVFLISDSLDMRLWRTRQSRYLDAHKTKHS
jgi:hypothetical protein